MALSSTSPMTPEEFINFGKIPDLVRDIRPFYGDPTKLVDWISDVESILRAYRDKGATAAQLSVLERTIRRKVDGEAANILNANNVLTSWSEIKDTLILYYKDQRDIKTLDFQLTSIRKLNNESLNSYYSRVNELLSLIIAQIQTDNKMKLSAAAHITYFREKSIDSFIRGLEKPLSILLKSSNPSTLSQAYNFCLEYHNMDIRSAPYKNEFGGQPVPKPRDPPILPPRMYTTQPKIFLPPPPPPPPRATLLNPFQNTYPARQNFSQTNPFAQNPFQQNPFAQKTFQPNQFRANSFQPNQFRSNYPPKPAQPMEVDQSLKTGALNYSNRPPLNLKRPYPPSQQYNPNAKRQAHPLETSHINPECYDWYDDQLFCYDDSFCYEPPQLEYEEEEVSVTDHPESNSESQGANFLEWHPKW